MMKKTKKTWKRQLDKLWSEIIRSKGYCEICGKTSNLNAHHIIGRVNKVLRWNLRNGICLCVLCHKFSKTSAHNDSPGFSKWFENYRPEDYEYLMIEKNKITHYTISDYEDIYQNLLKVRDEIQKQY